MLMCFILSILVVAKIELRVHNTTRTSFTPSSLKTRLADACERQ